MPYEFHEELEKLLKPIKNELDKVEDKKVKAYAIIFVTVMLGYKLLEGIYGENYRKKKGGIKQ